MTYANRQDAGVALATAVMADDRFTLDRPLVLGVARGGVPVAAVVARTCGGTLDVAVGRKLGAPRNPELAVGAVAGDGAPFLDDELIRRLRVTPEYLEAELRRQRSEVARRVEAYRDGAAPSPLTGRSVIVVDDGVATGSTLIAVLRSLRMQDPKVIVCAVPVGPPETVARLGREADFVVCPLQPRGFAAVGAWYLDFRQTSDDEVRAALRAAAGG